MDEFKKIIEIAFDMKKASKNFKEEFSKLTGDEVKEAEKKFKDSMKKMSASIAVNLGKGISDAIIKGAKEGIDEMKSMLEFSQLSSSKTREYAFNYGFSSSEAYGFEKALSAVGLESEEDLYYANQQELEQFRQAFESYSTQYSELYNSGFFKDLQEYQFEMENFKNEMKLQVVKFFMENKDTIKLGMKAIMEIAKTTLQIFSWLVNLFGEKNKAMTTGEILNQYSDVNNTSTNVNVNNNFNGVGKSDEQWLSDMGSLTYAQVIQALGGN